MPTAVHHSTADEVSGYVSEAVAIVEGASVPDDLRVAAFTATVGLLAAKQVFIDPSEVSPVARVSGVLTH